jgi:hypothetical protein
MAARLAAGAVDRCPDEQPLSLGKDAHSQMGKPPQAAINSPADQLINARTQVDLPISDLTFLLEVDT